MHFCSYNPNKFVDEDDDADMEVGFDEIMKEERRRLVSLSLKLKLDNCYHIQITLSVVYLVERPNLKHARQLWGVLSCQN